MTVRADAQQLSPQQLVEMFIWDDTIVGGATVFRWHPGTTVTEQPITWQGNIYEPYPIEATGFEITGTGQLPRPKLRAANIGGALGAYLRQMGGALGARLTRKRTYGKYLDAVNFPGGNPTANASQAFPDEIFYVARKVAENAIFIEIELAARFDVMGVQLPRRQVLAGICPWVYRSAECSYAGPPVYNDPVYPGQDKCGKTIDACKRRFGEYGVLRFGGFPASLLVRQ